MNRKKLKIASRDIIFFIAGVASLALLAYILSKIVPLFLDWLIWMGYSRADSETTELWALLIGGSYFIVTIMVLMGVLAGLLLWIASVERRASNE